MFAIGRGKGLQLRHIHTPLIIHSQVDTLIVVAGGEEGAEEPAISTFVARNVSQASLF